MEYAYLGCRSYFIMEETTAITFPCLAFFGNLYCFVSQWCFLAKVKDFINSLTMKLCHSDSAMSKNYSERS